LIAFKAIAGPFRPTGRFQFEPTDGGTRVTFSLEGELTGVKKLFMGGAAAKTMRSEVGTLENLKRLLEA
jgi:hypothetical protein